MSDHENEQISPTAETPVESPSPEEQPAEEQPAEEQPAETPPAETPPAETPPAETPPAETPPAETPPAEPVEAPPAEPAPEEPAPEAPAAQSDATAPARADEDASGLQEPKRRSRKRLARPLRRQRPRPKRTEPAARRPIVRLPKPEHEPGRRQERRGVVVSSAMDKTIVVRVDTVRAHPRYKKVVRRSLKFHAHDEQNAASVGDLVRIVETRPLSKTKNWRLAEILEAAK